jgi:hypothetical protein
MISGFVVMTSDGATSEPFEDRDDAVIWANETGMQYEVIDREKGEVVWTDEDQARHEEDSYDGQPSEYDEWMSFDPDC